MSKVKEILADPKALNKVSKAVFAQVDTDKSGYVSENELAALLGNVAVQCNVAAPSKAEIEQAMQSLDKNNDGQISFEEFKVMVIEILKGLEAKGM